MGKKANDRRKRIFAELYESGKLVKPERPSRAKPKPVVVVEVDDRCYCLRRMGNSIPNGFRRCIDCLDIRADRV